MTARYATDQEIANWDAHITDNPDGGTVFASSEYASIKRLTGYTPRFIVSGSLSITVLEKKTAPLGRLWYLPKGPNVTSTPELIKALRSLAPLAKKRGVFAIRIEPELQRSAQKTLERHGLIKAAPIIPSASTIVLDIAKPADELLLALPQKGRHAIRRAERDGVTTEQVSATEKNCRTMYALLQATAEGQFGIRSYNYYRTFWQTFEAAGLGQLFFAHYKGVVVAGAFAMAFGKKSTYKDGASVRQRTAYGASHLLQWAVIQWAQQKGAALHDFCGSPPSDEITNPDHPHYGVGLFKLSFSKDIRDYVGCYDYVLSPSRHLLWRRLGERIYRSLYYRRTKDYYY